MLPVARRPVMRMPTLLLPEITFRAPAVRAADRGAGDAIQVDAVARVPEIERRRRHRGRSGCPG